MKMQDENENKNCTAYNIKPSDDTNNNVQVTGEMRLKREIGLLEATAITVGAIIGSGIFISPKGIVSHVGSVGLSLVIWVICGLLSIIAAFCYAELGTTFPSAGGHYTYIYEAFGPLLAFLLLWSSTILFAPVANAILGLIVAKYMTQPFFPTGCEVPDSVVQLFAAISISLLTFLNCCDIRKTNKFVNTFMFLKLFALAIIIAGGMYALSIGKTENFSDPWSNSKTDIGGLVLATFSGSFAFAGGNALSNMMEELKDPNKNLPRAIFISLSSVTCIYLLTNVSYFAVLSPAEMIASDAVAVTFIEKLLGMMGWVVPIFVSLSTFGSLSIHIMTTSRSCLVGAREGQLPSLFSFITASNQTPTPSLIFLGVLSLFYLYISDVFVLITFSSITGGFFLLLTMTSLLYLRWKKPLLHRPFKVPLVFPIVSSCLSLLLFIIPIYVKPLSASIGAAITLTGLPVYYLFITKESQPKWLLNASESFTQAVQKLLMCVKED